VARLADQRKQMPSADRHKAEAPCLLFALTCMLLVAARSPDVSFAAGQAPLKHGVARLAASCVEDYGRPIRFANIRAPSASSLVRRLAGSVGSAHSPRRRRPPTTRCTCARAHPLRCRLTSG